MRARRLLLLLPLAPLTTFACFSQNSGGSGPTTNFDSGMTEFDGTTDAEPEASPVEAAADVSVEAAPIVDSSVDSPVDAGPMPITVAVVSPSGPESGVPVVFGDASGAVVGNAVQTVGGTVSTLQSGISMVTVLLGTPGTNTQAYTVMGVSPGDTVFVADLSSGTGLRLDITSIPTTPAFDGGVSQYVVTQGGCINTFFGGPPFSVDLDPYASPPCIGLQAMGGSYVPALPTLLQAYDSNYNVLGYAYTSQPVAALTPDDAGALDYGIGGSWSTALNTQVITAPNPADASFDPSLVYSEVFDGVITQTTGVQAPADAGPNSAAVLTHVGIAQAVQAEAFANLGFEAQGEGASVVTVAPPPTTSGSLTLDTSPIATAPVFQNTSLTGTTQPVVGWTLASGNLSQATGLIATVTWYEPTDGGNYANGTWTLVSPGTAGTSLTAPQLPASLQAAYAPNASAETDVSTIVVVYGQTALPTYSSMLQIGSLVQSNACNLGPPLAPALPGMGTAMFVALAVGSGC